MSQYRKDLELSDVPPAAEAPDLDGSLLVRATTGIAIRTLEYGAELLPLLSFRGLGAGSLTPHFMGGPRQVERLRDLLTRYLERVESAEAVASEDRREAGASEEGS